MGITIFSRRLSSSSLNVVAKTQRQLTLPGFQVETASANRDSQTSGGFVSHLSETRKPTSEELANTCNFQSNLQARVHPTSAVGRLKIVRELEQGSSPLCAGRMRMSGRMADVCAELERMTRLAQAGQKIC